MLVSVVIPTHNRAALLPRAIGSVLAQTYSHLECIVVDDASTDDTPHVVQQFVDERLIYLRHETNRYASAARNTGIAHARGELIAFLDDDDEWLPDKLARQVAFMQGLPKDVGMVYCWMDYFDDQDHLVREHHPTLKGHVFEQTLVGQPLGGCPTLLVRREAVEKVKGFDESLPRGNDGDFIRRVCRHYAVDVVPEVLVKVHTGHGFEQITRENEQGIRNRILGKRDRIAKFSREYEQHRPQYAIILADLALCYAMVSDRSQAAKYYLKAFFTYPISTAIYRNIYKSLRLSVRELRHDH